MASLQEGGRLWTLLGEVGLAQGSLPNFEQRVYPTGKMGPVEDVPLQHSEGLVMQSSFKESIWGLHEDLLLS